MAAISFSEGRVTCECGAEFTVESDDALAAAFAEHRKGLPRPRLSARESAARSGWAVGARLVLPGSSPRRTPHGAPRTPQKATISSET